MIALACQAGSCQTLDDLSSVVPGAFIVIVFLVSLYHTRVLEARRRAASLLLIRDTRFFKSAVKIMRKLQKAKRPKDRVKMAMGVTSFVPEDLVREQQQQQEGAEAEGEGGKNDPDRWVSLQ